MDLAAWLGAGGAALLLGSCAGNRRTWRPVRRTARMGGTLLILPWGLLQLATGSLDGYQRLSGDRPAAEIRFEQLGPQAFRAVVRLPDHQPVEWTLRGDEWQIDARILTWRPWARWLGLPPWYRFERISGRYSAIDDEQTAPRTVHPLGETDDGFAWRLLLEAHPRMPGADAAYGTAAFLPMADRARYLVSVSPSGLVARPDNPEAEQAVRAWTP